MSEVGVVFELAGTEAFLAEFPALREAINCMDSLLSKGGFTLGARPDTGR